MAETLTVENQSEAEVMSDAGELTPDEQDSLQVGEQLQEQQEQLLAGKYRDAQELEKAYIELQGKLGEKSEPETPEESSDEPEAEAKDETKDEPIDTSVLDDLFEEAISDEGKFSKETLGKINNMSKEEITQQYLQWRANASNRYVERPPDLTQKDVQELKGLVGGADNYTNMLQWAKSNLTEQEVTMFDNVMSNGDINSAFFAVNSLAQRYNDKVGYDGRMLTGKAAKQTTDTYRSQAEVVKAMSDPRYDNDPAYRQDIMEKLDRSDVQF